MTLIALEIDEKLKETSEDEDEKSVVVILFFCESKSFIGMFQFNISFTFNILYGTPDDLGDHCVILLDILNAVIICKSM